MKPTLDLFELIQSLTPSEKRYVRIFSNLHVIQDKNNYARLFDAILSQEKYDEQELKKQLKGGTLESQFAVAKNNLHKLILRSLRFYNSGKTANSNLIESIEIIEILYNKGLFAQAKKEIDKAKKEAALYDKVILPMELFKWEKKIFMMLSPGSIPKDAGAKLHLGEMTAFNKVSVAFQYNKLLSQFLSLTSQSTQMNKNQMDGMLEHFMEDPLLLLEPAREEFYAYLFYHRIHSDFYRLTKNFPKSIYHLDKILNNFVSKSQIIAEEPIIYLDLLTSKYHLAIDSNDLKKAEEVNKNIERFLKDKISRTKGKKTERLFAVYRYYVKTDLLMTRGEYEKGLTLAKEIKEVFPPGNFETNHIFLLPIWYNMALFHVASGIYSDALDWLQPFIQSGKNIRRHDLFTFARILQMIIHYHLSEEIVTEHLIRKHQNNVSQNGKVLKLEDSIVRCLNKLLHAPTKEKKKKILERKALKFAMMYSMPEQQKSFHLFNACQWIEAELKEVPMKNIKPSQPFPMEQREYA